MASVLWLFAHQALAPLFHQDPRRFVETLDGGTAPDFLEKNWAWAQATAGELGGASSRPPLTYGIERPRAGLAIVWMRFEQVAATGEPWQARFIVRDADPGMENAYTRMFMLEHSEYASELEAKPQAIACESLADGRHRNWGVTMAPDDEQSFERFVVETLKNNPQPAAEWVPPK